MVLQYYDDSSASYSDVSGSDFTYDGDGFDESGTFDPVSARIGSWLMFVLFIVAQVCWQPTSVFSILLRRLCCDASHPFLCFALRPVKVIFCLKADGSLSVGWAVALIPYFIYDVSVFPTSFPFISCFVRTWQEG